jgi:hypothetical protein
MAFLQPLGQLRSPVSTYANLPLTGNVHGDLRISTDTGDAYTWMLVESSGSLSDWNKVTTASYSDLIGAPYSTALDIDNAVKVVTGLAINISLLAFNTLTGFGAAVARMFDGVVHQFNSDDSGLEIDECSNYTQIDNTYYMPNKGDLDIYTRMLIHGDGIQGSTAFVDLMRLPLYNHGAITDTTTKKFGTGSIKFDGTNDSCDLGRLVEGTATQLFYMPMCLDFWLYSNASGLQPILSNEEYIAEEYYQTSYDAGEVISIKKNASNKIEVTILVDEGYDINGRILTPVTVESASTISSSAWHHIAVQHTDTGYVEIWIDGVKDATSTLHPVPEIQVTYPVVLTLGKLGSAYLSGYLDEIRLSNIVRYTTTFTPMTKAYNTATEPAPTPEIVDESGDNKEISVYGNARMSGNNPLFGNASLYLDGINSYISTPPTGGESIGGIDEYTKLMLHLNNDTIDSEITPKIVTNSGVTFSNSGKINQAGLFTNTSYLQVPNADGSLNFGSGSWTFDMWLKTTSLSSTQVIFSDYKGYGSYSLCYYDSHKLYFGSRNTGVAIDFSTTNSVINDTDWHHVAIVYDSVTYRIFVDGVNSGTTITQAIGTIPNIDTTAFQIGATLSVDDSTLGWIGYIDEFRISNGIARWTTNFTPLTQEYTKIDENDWQLCTDVLEDYTVDLWIDPLQITDLNTFIIGQEDSWKLTLDGTSNKYLKYTVIGGASAIAPISLSLETWHHVAIVQKDGVIKLYINGVLGASVSGTQMVDGNNNLTIGADSNGEHFFNGFIEEVRISKGIARWTDTFTPPSSPYNTDSYTKLLLPLNVQTVPNMVLQSVGYVANYVPSSARIVIFEEDIDEMEQNVDLKVEISRDGGTTFTSCLIAKDQEFGDGTLNLFTGSVDLASQPNGELLVWKLTTQNNKDCRIRGVSLNWR